VQDLTTASTATQIRRRAQALNSQPPPPPPPPSHECTFTELPNWEDNPRKQFDINSAPLWPYPEAMPLQSEGQIQGTQTWEECVELCKKTPGCVYVYRPGACFKPGNTQTSRLRTKWTGGDPRYNFARMCFMYNNYNPYTGTMTPPPPHPPPPPPVGLVVSDAARHMCYNGIRTFDSSFTGEYVQNVLDRATTKQYGAYNWISKGMCKEAQNQGGCCFDNDQGCRESGQCATCDAACDLAWSEYLGACVDNRGQVAQSLVGLPELSHTNEGSCRTGCCYYTVCSAMGLTSDECVACQTGCTVHYTSIAPTLSNLSSNSAQYFVNAPPTTPPSPLSPGGEAMHWMSDEWCPGTTTSAFKGLGDSYQHAYSSCHDSTFAIQTHSFGHTDESTTGIAVNDINRDGYYDLITISAYSYIRI